MTPAETVRQFLIGELHWDEDRHRLTPDYPLIENHVVDSLGLFTLVGFIEDQFGIAVADEDLLPENFGTIQAIIGLIDKKRASA